MFSKKQSNTSLAIPCIIVANTLLLQYNKEWWQAFVTQCNKTSSLLAEHVLRRTGFCQRTARWPTGSTRSYPPSTSQNVWTAQGRLHAATLVPGSHRTASDFTQNTQLQTQDHDKHSDNTEWVSLQQHDTLAHPQPSKTSVLPTAHIKSSYNLKHIWPLPSPTIHPLSLASPKITLTLTIIFR